jgi:hypothetical protein
MPLTRRIVTASTSATLPWRYPRTFFPQDPITKVVEDDLDGFGGALLPSESGKRWGILYDRNTSPQRRRFTIGHEFVRIPMKADSCSD